MDSSDSSSATIIDAYSENTSDNNNFERLSSQITMQGRELNDKFDRMFKFLTETTMRVEDNKQRINQLETTSSNTAIHVQEVQTRVSKIEDEHHAHHTQMEHKFQLMTTNYNLLTEKIMKLEAASQKLSDQTINNQDQILYTSFLLEGLPETNKQENTRDTVVQVLKRIDPNANDSIIDFAFRQNSNRYPRPIRFSFLKKSDADFTIRNKHCLNKNKAQGERPIFINQISSIQTMRQRNDLRLVVKAAYDANLTMAYRGDHVVFEGKRYYHKDIGNLPSRISIIACKTRVTTNSIGFRSPLSPLSNLYPCTLKIANINFNSAEQALQYHRALLLKDIMTQKKIMELDDPFKIMLISKHLKGPAWDGHKTDILYSILREKFEQNPSLAEYILLTEGRHLVECTLDREWGAGISLFSSELDNLKFPGKNMTGYALMQIRSDLKRSSSTSVLLPVKKQERTSIVLDYQLKALTSELERTRITTQTPLTRATTIIFKSINLPSKQDSMNTQTQVSCLMQNSSLPPMTTNQQITHSTEPSGNPSNNQQTTQAALEEESPKLVTVNLMDTACALPVESAISLLPHLDERIKSTISDECPQMDMPRVVTQEPKQKGKLTKKSRRTSMKIGRYMIRQTMTTPANKHRNLDHQEVYNYFKNQPIMQINDQSTTKYNVLETTKKYKGVAEETEQDSDDDLHLSQTPFEKMRREQREEQQQSCHPMNGTTSTLLLNLQTDNGISAPTMITTRSKSIN